MGKFGMILIIGLVAWGLWWWQRPNVDPPTPTNMDNLTEGAAGGEAELSIASLRAREYPGSEIVIEEKLPAGSNYDRYRVAYRSDGLKIYALLTVPRGTPPEPGWPAIVFNHGYIQPSVYRTTERYVAYVDGFARSGYVVIKPDYRGHGSSEGTPSGAYGSNDYTIDVLNALASIRRYPGVNPERMGMWGHSMGGFITLRAMVVDPGIKAGVIWGGVVGSYADLLNNWRRRSPFPSPSPSGTRRWREVLTSQYGTPEQNKAFWDSISANSFVADISGPVQLQHGEADASVPVEFSRTLERQLKDTGEVVELYTYPGDDHDITRNFGVAMRRSVEWFDQYLNE